jgi:hypothetical protein
MMNGDEGNAHRILGIHARGKAHVGLKRPEGATG